LVLTFARTPPHPAKAGAADGAPFDVFLSHTWQADEQGRDTHGRVERIAAALERKHGMRVWLDTAQMKGNVDVAMSAGIDLSKVVLAFATKKYMDKVNSNAQQDNCLKEFFYASQKRHGYVVPVAFEECMRMQGGWGGPFKLNLPPKQPFDFSTDAAFDKQVADLAELIRLRQRVAELPLTVSPELRDLKGALLPTDFDAESWPQTKAKLFVQGTRKWVFDAVDAWAASTTWTQVFVLMGTGGIGKSVFCAELLRRGKEETLSKQSEPGKRTSLLKQASQRLLSRLSLSKAPALPVVAQHFFRHDDDRMSNAKNALMSIAWQLCLTVTGFKDHLQVPTKTEVADMHLVALFKQVVAEPARKVVVASSQRRAVVVLDALDECDARHRMQVLAVAAAWKDEMPDWLGLVMSTRPDDYIPAKVKSFSPTELNTDDQANVADMKLYLKALLQGFVRKADLVPAVAVLAARSEGLFVYASFLEDTLRRL